MSRFIMLVLLAYVVLAGCGDGSVSSGTGAVTTPTPISGPTAPSLSPNGSPVSLPRAGSSMGMSSPTLAPSLGQVIDAYVSSLTAQNRFSGAVLVALDGKIILDKGYGFQNAMKDIPNSPDTSFPIASMSKMFTAAGVLLLEDQGKLHVQDRVCRYVPNCPATWQSMTIQNLLTHTAGISRNIGGPPPPNLESAVGLLEALPLDFAPGSRWQYSDNNYVVVAYIIQKVTGQRFQSWMEQHVFMPLHLSETGYGYDLATTPNLAVGYKTMWKPNYGADYPYQDAAGGLYTSLRDMYQWDQSLYTTRLLPQSQLKAMFTPRAAAGNGYYGYGWYIRKRYGHMVEEHGGAEAGFRSFIARIPDSHSTIIILSNLQATDRIAMARQIYSLLYSSALGPTRH